MKKVEIFIPIEPIPKGRPRFTKQGHSYTPPRTLEYEKAVREYYKEHCGEYFDTAIKVHLVFNMPIPQSASKKKKNMMATGIIKCTVHNGDVDNLTKAVTDAINGIAYRDDCLITKLTIIKQYATDNNVGTEVIITEDVD